ncbi:MAG TPA: hypothetical protein QKA14_00915 [Candidatus Megaira endosymbiont of Hartmannula sinica]|nr:hypothetical protein [Candidatus Megaera endosymbiont of Hartmannula sinica]
MEDGLSPKDIEIIDISNRHFVIFSNTPWKENKIKILVNGIEDANLFPGGVNINFAYLKSKKEIDLIVWERGTGITLACGSGACASFYAAISLGVISKDEVLILDKKKGKLVNSDSCSNQNKNYIKINFKLGYLKLCFNKNNEILMRGNSQYCFRGNII